MNISTAVTSKVYCLVPSLALASVALIVKVLVPNTVGVPVNEPDDATESPVGIDVAPVVTEKLYGLVPPLAVNSSEYGVLISGSGKVVGSTVIVTASTVMVYCLSPTFPLTSVANIVNVVLPSVLDLPVIAPLEVIENTPMEVPPLTENTYGPVPPLADNVSV